jgi:hypothetical protein
MAAQAAELFLDRAVLFRHMFEVHGFNIGYFARLNIYLYVLLSAGQLLKLRFPPELMSHFLRSLPDNLVGVPELLDILQTHINEYVCSEISR